MEDIPVTDNHIHVDPIHGEGPVAVATKFKRAGGSVMISPNKPTWTVGESCTFKEAMELGIKYVDTINTETDIKAFAVVGAHPAELSRRVKEGLGLEKGEKIMRGALETAQKLVLDGRAVGIGEVGRPHYEVSTEELQVHNRLINYAMELAKDANCPVQLHTETSGPAEFKEFAKMADEAGLKRSQVIKHFSGPMVLDEENHGLTPSLIATRDVVTEGVEKLHLKLSNGKLNFIMETDYMDDLSRPGAVLGPKTVPRRTRELLEKGIITEDEAYRIHVENVERIYHVDLGF
ncbi:TatD family hydrolase [Methanobacterium congolense]|uniref:Uncharacterized protein n=1 Tax=Methanobacterium congolense TaxID=118062 RepID=A0A1D3L3E6_9EURY|nr:TatD family hydrolase [Methanobacterium congolense]SCG86151.1 putative protein MJ1127 [Methanobacterium congolense]